MDRHAEKAPVSGSSAALATLDRATRMLAEVRSYEEAKAVVDIAEAARVYAKTAGLGLEAQNHAAEIKIRAQRMAGKYLAPIASQQGKRNDLPGVLTFPAGGRSPSKVETYESIGVSRGDAHRWEAMSEIPPDRFEEVIAEGKGGGNELTTKYVYDAIRETEKKAKQREREQKLAETTQSAEMRPALHLRDCFMFDPGPVDLLLTDPPYSTEVEDIVAFAPKVVDLLKYVKPTGRAYVFTGSYPDEMRAYLNAPCPRHMTLSQILVWTYRNTMGPAPHLLYKNNWQAIFYYTGEDAPPLDCPELNELFSVQDINAPDGRLGDRCHSWQKPIEIAERFIRHATKPGDSVYDPFACTGTFLIAAAKWGRPAVGCEKEEEFAAIAESRGVKLCRDTEYGKSPATGSVTR